MNNPHLTKPIKFIQFGALTASQWRNFAEMVITTPSNRGNSETIGTPNDIRLGSLANNEICGTCGEKNKTCPGHWSIIPLEEPCYNPEYIDIVLGIFRCICIKCKAPRIDESMSSSFTHLKVGARYKAYKKKAETLKQCSACGEILQSFFIDKYMIKRFYEDKKKAIPVTARETLAILLEVSSETMKLFGFNGVLSSNPSFLDEDSQHLHEIRPEAYVFSNLPVPPPCTRPYVMKGSEKKDDDITDKYNTIVKNNIKLRADREARDMIPTGMAVPKGRKRGGILSEADRRKTVDLLFSNIWSLIDNTKDTSKNTNRQHKGYRQRLSGKDGHIQGNVAGKRSDFTARTVIVGGGDILPIGWFGVPEYVAQKLTIPELVVSWNIDECERLLKEGKVNTVARGGNFINVSQATKNHTQPFKWKDKEGLQIYDIIARHLRDGDPSICNRQPTLRIESMLGVKVKVMKGEYTFRLPLGMTRPLNADFDGDEINLACPQNLGARAEIMTACKTAYHIVSAQNNAPIMGCVQNTLVCMYILTESFLTPEMEGDFCKGGKFEKMAKVNIGGDKIGYQTMVSKRDFMDAITVASIDIERYNDLLARAAKVYPNAFSLKKGILTPNDFLPGKVVASIVFPKNFTWSRKTDVNEILPIVKIKDGIILPDSGPLCKKSIGGAAGSAIHPLWKISPDIAASTISELQFMATVLITRLGFSMGISDCLAVDNGNSVKNAVGEALIKCELINNSKKDDADKEREINTALNEAMEVAPKLAKTGMNKTDRNALVIMKRSGAKGSDVNNGQIAGFVGQQNIDGKRIPFMLNNGTRTLTCFFPNDNSPEARGFVKHSYLEGLDYRETWFHAMAGRRGVVDTGLKTADSGYVQKKIVNAINDFKARPDGSIRDANGVIVEFAYGGDGLNAKELMFCKGLDYPIFFNADVMVGCLNSDAERLMKDGEIDNIGLMRKLQQDEIDLLVSFIHSSIPGSVSEVSVRMTYNIRQAIRVCISEVKIYEYMIPTFFRAVRDEYERAKVPNGYMAGIIGSCAIGEPTTQMSALGVQKVPLLIVDKKSLKNIYTNERIEDTICQLIEDEQKNCIIDGKNTILYPQNVDIFVNTVDPNTSKVSWQKVLEVSRHPANGKLIKVETKSGRSTITTLSHSHLCRDTNGVIVPIRGDELKIGDAIPVCGKLNAIEGVEGVASITEVEICGWMYPLDFEMGWLFGAYLSEGCIVGGRISITNISKEFEERCHSIADRFGGKVYRRETFGHIQGSVKKYQSITNTITGLNDLGRYIVSVCGKGSANKHIPAFSLFASEEFVSGLLRGYFDGDGNVNVERQLIRIHSISRDLIETIALLLSRFGIFGTIGIEKPGGRENEQQIYCYRILRKHAQLYMDHVGSDFPERRKAIQDIIDYNNRDKVYSVKEETDMIPNIGQTISDIAWPLRLPGYSRTYKRFEKKKYIGRETLKKYIKVFEDNDTRDLDLLDILKTAAESHIIWDQITSLTILDDPKTYVYDLGVEGNHTFMMQSGIFTHNTLNSIDWKEVIYVRENSKVILEPIGKFIDNIISTEEENIQYLPNEQIYVDVKDKGWEMVSVDEDGKMHWKHLEAVTRHLPGGKMLRVTTHSGKQITATKGLSFLTRKDNKLVGTLGSELKVGNLLPVMKKFPETIDELTEIDVSLYLPKNESSENLLLNWLSGFLFGAYMTGGGYVTETFVYIANNDETFRNKIYEFCHTYKIAYEIFPGSTSIKIHSTMFAKILGDSCGYDNRNKKIPEWALIANIEFIRGLLTGYFDGDGMIDITNELVSCRSVSETLILGLTELLAKFGIYGYMSKNILQTYYLHLLGENSLRYVREVGSLLPGIINRLKDITLNENCEVENALNQDVYYDDITKIEEVDSSTKYVYDVTIADTRNFGTFGGLTCKDTFHSSGISAKDVTLGVPRLKEVLNATKKPSRPTCTIYVNDQTIKDNFQARKEASSTSKSTPDADKKQELDREIAELDKSSLYHISSLAAPLAYLTIDALLKEVSLQYLLLENGDPPKSSPLNFITYEQYPERWWVTLREALAPDLQRFKPESWVVLLHLDIDKMYKFGLSTDVIAMAIEEESFGPRGYAMSCVPSPNNIAQIEVYLNFSEISQYSRQKLEFTSEGSRNLIDEENIDYFTMREVVIDMIRKTRVQGVSGITKTYPRQDKNGEWIIDTQGTNLIELLGIEGIDSSRTTSDDMWEIYSTLGIEATRKFLIKEITKLLSFDGTYINMRHIALLADGMTRMGIITSVNRDGIPRDVGPIAKGMFEKPVDNMGDAAAFGEYDRMKGVMASVMYGTLPEVGTGTVEIKDRETLPSARVSGKIDIKEKEVEVKEGKKEVKQERKPIGIPLKPKKVKK